MPPVAVFSLLLLLLLTSLSPSPTHPLRASIPQHQPDPPPAVPCRQPHALLVRSAGFLNQLLALGGPGAVLPQSGVTVPELRGDFSLNAGTSFNDDSRRVKKHVENGEEE